MSKFAFLTIGTKGDLFPFLGIAKELRRRKHEVVFIGSEAHRKMCETEGIQFEGVIKADDHEKLLSHPDIWKPITGLKLYLREVTLGTAEPVFRVLEKHAQKGPVSLVMNNLCLGGLIAHEKLGLPTAGVFLQPYAHISPSDPPKDSPLLSTIAGMVGVRGRRLIIRLIENHFNAELAPVNEIRVRLGLKPVQDIVRVWRNSAPVMLDLWPEWFASGKPEWPPQAVRTGFITYDGPAAPSVDWKHKASLTEFLKKKPIVFSMGSEMLQDFSGQRRLFSEACRISSRPGLFVSAAIEGDKTEDVGANFKVIRAAPFSELFPLSSAVLCHGGIGSVARILAAGRPAIIAPLGYDQFDNGYHVERLGVGLSLPYRSLNPKKLANALEAVFRDPRYSENALQLSQRMQVQDGTIQAADLLEERLL